jgi:septum formation protein
MAAPQLILASASPRRRDLLRQVGLDFQMDAPDVDESTDSSLAPAEIVERLAARKAEAVAARHAGAIVLGSDTLVFLGNQALGKPGDAAESRAFLQRLSGQTHQVYSGLCLLETDGGRREVGHSRTNVRMRTLSREDINEYVAANESADKAGGYAIQGRGAFLIEEIQGDYSNVVGLPLALLYEFLTRLGFRPLRNART